MIPPFNATRLDMSVKGQGLTIREGQLLVPKGTSNVGPKLSESKGLEVSRVSYWPRELCRVMCSDCINWSGPQ